MCATTREAMMESIERRKLELIISTAAAVGENHSQPGAGASGDRFACV
jgi:hypothetical protein